MLENSYEVLSALRKISEEINFELNSIFDKYSLDSFMVDTAAIKEKVIASVFEDLEVLKIDDPANRGFYNVAWTSLAFKAVRYYRYANCIFWESENEIEKDYRLQIVREISEQTKIETKVEIHPLATIGKKFLIDHGVNTVIGERCEIGDNCMVLNDVVLGSSFDANIPAEQRHPKIGNNVKIYGGAKVLGSIYIGHDCIIGARCIVRKSLENGSTVSIVNQLQIHRGPSLSKFVIYGVIPKQPNLINIIGENFLQFKDDICIEIIDDKYNNIIGVETILIAIDESKIEFKINQKFNFKNCCIKIFDSINEIIITDCMGLINLNFGNGGC
jgi:serine acetyltransferase